MRKGFSLIELLVVISIIAILTAIIFPVFARARASAYQSGDMSHMNSIRTALQLYRTDQGAYPPALLGYADAYDNAPTNVLPANQVVGALYPKLVDSLETLRPAYVRPNGSNLNAEVATAVWPNKAAGQKFGPTDGNVRRCVLGAVRDNYYYRISGYDAAEVPTGGVTKRNELRYTLFWSDFTVPTNPCNPTSTEQGSVLDNPRQLGYSDPPESTVITWNTFFRDLDASGQPTRTKKDVVLFLGGAARTHDSVDVSLKS